MAFSNSSRKEYERLMNQFQPAIANRDRMVSQYCGATAVQEQKPEEQPAPAKRGGFVMALYRLFGIG